MIPQLLPVRYFLNPRVRRDLPFGPSLTAILSREANEAAYREISTWEEYAPTPLRSLPSLAGALGLGSIRYKDEGERLGLGSFKSLGGAYGVLRVIQERMEARGLGASSPRELREGALASSGMEMTVTCASAGNHGESVAWGAAIFGCRAVILLPSGTAPSRGNRIRGLGARVREVEGSYDDAVREARRLAGVHGWEVISDTAYPGYMEVPRYIMQGYTVLAREVLHQLPGGVLPTHLFVQGGVGGLAAALTGYLWEELGVDRPRVVVVEPAEADCLLESALSGSPVPSRGGLDTVMSCLACRYPSLLAWDILESGADAFLTIPDQATREVVDLLAAGAPGQDPVLSQPSGVAGLTGLLAAAFEPTLSGPLGLTEESVVLVIGSEGPGTDPA